jgi:hypothetical protein
MSRHPLAAMFPLRALSGAIAHRVPASTAEAPLDYRLDDLETEDDTTTRHKE